MSFGFSVGDFISGINLIKELIEALKEYKGSSQEFLELNNELHELERAMLDAKTLQWCPDEAAQCAALQHAITLCRASIDNFMHTISKYPPHLRLGGSLNRHKDMLRKVQWRFCKREDVVRFRAQIGFHARSIQMLMLSTLMLVTPKALEQI